MEGILLLTSLFLIIPIYIITIKNVFLKEKNTYKWIFALIFNPTFPFLFTAISELLLLTIFDLKSTIFVELILLVVSNLVGFGIFVLLFDKKRENLFVDFFIYMSFVLVELTTTMNLLFGYSDFETILSGLICPLISYILYYFIISKKLPIVLNHIEKNDSILINVMPCVACVIILVLQNTSNIFALYLDENTYHTYNIALYSINYLILIFEYLAYYIIFSNIERKIALIEMNDKVIKTQEQIIDSFSMVIENSNESTGNHVKRVSEYTKVLAKALGFSSDDVDKIGIAAMLHDVGKVYIPNEILEKPGKLTDDEFDLIKTHVTKGEHLLHNIDGDLMDMAKIIALQHHEKWNGKGYLGMKGDEIDLLARIVTVADVFDALVDKRSYKQAWTTEDAYNLIVSEKGNQFDPIVVDAFIENFDSILEVYKNY